MPKAKRPRLRDVERRALPEAIKVVRDASEKRLEASSKMDELLWNPKDKGNPRGQKYWPEAAVVSIRLDVMLALLDAAERVEKGDKGQGYSA